jgi:RNA polymerase-binding protein DksA
VQDKDLKALRTKILLERERLVTDLDSLEESTSSTSRDASGDLSSYSSHMADQGTDAMEREKAFLFASVKRKRLEEIDLALQRMDAGTFGVCESCGKDIPPKRLERVPDASLCVSCKEQQEKEQSTRS